jgi:methyltransferase
VRTIVVAALAYSAGMRLFEVLLSRRNARRLERRGARAVPQDGFGLIAAVHALWFVALAVEETALGPAYSFPVLQAVAGLLFVLAEAIRLWCIRTLGDRWNTRILVLDGEPPVRAGPYRYARHPNYAAAAVGLVALPVALGLPWTAALLALPKLLAVRRRIRIEERALSIAAPACSRPADF